MRFQGNTDTDDWNPIALFWMMGRRECWHFGWYWREWRLGAWYVWYDGPHWQLCAGPFYLHIGYDR
jgi:hypothetical protein